MQNCKKKSTVCFQFRCTGFYQSGAKAKSFVAWFMHVSLSFLPIECFLPFHLVRLSCLSLVGFDCIILPWFSPTACFPTFSISCIFLLQGHAVWFANWLPLLNLAIFSFKGFKTNISKLYLAENSLTHP